MNEELISKFYTAFQSLDSETMSDCYNDDIEFTDPAFGTIKGKRAKAMWKMLCQNSKDLKVEFSNIFVDEQNGSAHWEATYTFSRTGRKVVNSIDAKFEFKSGKISKHIDHFNLHKWASQAMGFKGWLLGGTSFFKKKLQEQANHSLDKYLDSLK